MPEEFDNLSQHEALRAENEFIKMKLMLEHGADFQYSEGSGEVSPETEHEFLNYIMDFEQRKQGQVRGRCSKSWGVRSSFQVWKI